MKKAGEQRELRYASNQNSSPFVDEQKGEIILGHIIFEDGAFSEFQKKNKIYKNYFHYIILN